MIRSICIDKYDDTYFEFNKTIEINFIIQGQRDGLEKNLNNKYKNTQFW